MSNIDIVPELLDQIQENFKEQFKKNSKVTSIYGKIRSKVATYNEANEFAIQCGEMLANSFKKYISVDSLPEGRMWYNIASRILEPTLHTNYSLITDVSNQVQNIFNESQGLGLKSITPQFNQNKVKGLIDKVSNAENYEDVEWVLQEPIVNFSQAIVDDAIKSNAQFHYESGLTPKIVRKAESGCCKWCANLEGEYEYPYVPSDVYRRHERCRCTVEYVRDGKYQNVWTKRAYYESIERNAIGDVELYRKKFTINENGEQKTYKQAPRKATRDIIKSIENMGGTVIIADSEMEQHLNKRGATALTIDDTVVFKSNHTISDLLEEERHLWQNINRINDDKIFNVRIILNEIEAKEYLLNQKRYNIPLVESNDTKKQLEELKEQLNELIKKGLYNEDN